MNKLLSYCKPYKKQFILGPLFKLTEALLELTIPLVMAALIDKGVKSGDIGLIIKYGLLILLIACLGALAAFTCQYYASIASQGVGTNLRRSLLHQIGTLSYTELDKLGTSSLVNRLSGDINQLQAAVAMTIRLVIRVPFLVIGGLVMSMLINFKLALILLLILPLIVVTIYFIMRKSLPIFREVQKKGDTLTLDIKENLSGARVIRAFNRQSDQSKSFTADNHAVYQANLRINYVTAFLHPASSIIINFSIIAILWFGGLSVNTGSMTQGEIVAFINYATMISSAIIVCANLITIFTKAQASATRVLEILQTTSSIVDPESPKPVPNLTQNPILQFNHVSFSYHANQPTPTAPSALTDIDFKIDAGMTVGIIGATGSGKSTLAHLLYRLYDPNMGNITLGGTDLRELKQAELRKTIGLIPQKITLFSGSIRENICSGQNGITDKEVELALNTAQCDFVYELPLKIYAPLEQGGNNLSGGQKQRLTIARALVGRPQILVFDDALTALDPITYANLIASLKKNYKNTTTLFISQRVHTIKNCDLILVLDNGALVGMGKSAQLLKSCSVYREIAESQDN